MKLVSNLTLFLDAGLILLTNAQDIIIGKLGLWKLKAMRNLLWKLLGVVIVASWGFVATLGAHVVAVGLMIAKEKVSRVDAGSVVAMMQNKGEFTRNLANFGEVTESVGFDLLPPEVKCSVSPSPQRGSPLPTLTKFWPVLWNRSIFVYFSPESLALFFSELDLSGRGYSLALGFIHGYDMLDSSGPCPTPVGRGCAPILAKTGGSSI